MKKKLFCIIAASLLLGTCKKKSDDLPITEPEVPTPIVITSEAGSVTENAAIIGGHVSNAGTSNLTETGVFYDTLPINHSMEKWSTIDPTSGTFTVQAYNLLANKTYYYMAYATNASGTSYGEQKSFRTLPVWSVVKGIFQFGISCLRQEGSTLYAGTQNGLYISTDKGELWSAKNGALSGLFVGNLAFNNDVIYASCMSLNGNCCYRSTDNGTNWTATNLTYPATAFATVGNTLVAGTFSNGIFRWNENSALWESVNPGFGFSNITDMASMAQRIFVSTSGAGVYYSDNAGSTWTACNTGLTFLKVGQVEVAGSRVYAGTVVGLYVSDNDGSNWTRIQTPATTSSEIGRLNVLNEVICFESGGTFLSKDNGVTWTDTPKGLNKFYATSLLITDGKILAGTTSGIWKYPL